ncbi:hypothetical protein CVS40_12950 [Lucilia cuprina]|nr:hypothetical protein CVS40_12950 [Lucilia cuprina]
MLLSYSLKALNAARAKQLRIKFEKWQANEIKREKDDEFNHNICGNNVSDETSIESTQSIRDRFEKMRNVEKPAPTLPRHPVNRFVFCLHHFCIQNKDC